MNIIPSRLFALTVLAVTTCVSGNGAFAHESHASMTEVEWNQKTGRFEVAMKLHIADLEDSVSLRTGKRFRMPEQSNVPELVQQWLADSFEIAAGTSKRDSNYHWVGMELELHDAWLYFEVEPKTAAARDNRVEEWDQLFSKNDDSSINGRKATTIAGQQPASIHVRHQALFRVQPEQKNLVSVTVGGLTKSSVLIPGRETATISFRSPQARANRIFSGK